MSFNVLGVGTEMLSKLSSPVTEATEGGLKLLPGQMVKCGCLKVPGCQPLTTIKYAALLAVVVLWTPLGFVELVA